MKEFHERFGMEPAGVWSAPGRVNLIGEHTDYNDGFVLPFAIPMRTTVAARPADGPFWTVYSRETGETVVISEADLRPGAVNGWAAYVAGVPWALRAAGHRPPFLDLAITSDVPLGAGLSSSAALTCAVLAALVDLGGLDLSRDDWPAVAQRAENSYVGAPTGIMDQSASTLCRPGHAMFLDCRSGDREHVPFALAEHDLAMLVIDSRAPHSHADGEYAARRASCESAAQTLGLRALRDLAAEDLPAACGRLDEVTARRVRHVVTENARVLETVEKLRGGSVTGIGPLLTASHASMRDDYEITVPEIDTAVETALAAGAYGARMTGGGFGGCVLALVDADAAERVADAVTAAFAERGFTAPTWFRAVAAGGATREA
ncbi:galactokinase [Virgisporangium ochraceum]|uniref:Galactokinase n=1 Tax=Virgisporangium ochraceum TaxID=65505 RepID=A0A8J4EB64_9ACTN|nr:galactokinase [Virgisporangium ochraceum]GIJ68259.1 galactokinase [Virgisporangium ochraceum]